MSMIQTKTFPKNEHHISGQAKFRIQNLSLTRNDALLLSDINLIIPTGKIITLIGPSGSGKSSLLRCLNRLWEPPPDTVFLDEVELTSLDVLTLRRRVGMLLQHAALFEGTVADNIRYGPALQGQQLSDERVAELLQMVNLEPSFADKSSRILSGGEAQRVSIARTLANQPEVLLLDEPTSALDPAATRIVEETILCLRVQLGLTVVWVSHTLPQVERVADYMVLLVDGAVVETGSPAHLLSGEHPHLTESFAAGELVSKREGQHV
ncbi:phosphate ABC transporter ATP-binding protein [Anaerolineales bacterium HSG24]|nr:phosphate ABC transporter ATP-binding protein [Anaerolineales bacterium HSG24]